MNKQYELLVNQLATERGVTDNLKRCNQLLWGQEMNLIKNYAQEMIFIDFINNY